jgi:hypothetical protein
MEFTHLLVEVIIQMIKATEHLYEPPRITTGTKNPQIA